MELNTFANVRVLFFAKSRELVGEKETVINYPSRISTRRILNELLERYNSLSVISENLILSLNEEYLDINDDLIINLKTGDELAVIPPISGG
ncbi:hypothetical protein SNE40_012634 [Patella caerulea]|uniref:Molybdopterin synthase sulfur carrier subunit n=1 Tax=Patella caerulea TaxID=87958 RepID=A0AAN8JUT6_PATCE